MEELPSETGGCKESSFKLTANPFFQEDRQILERVLGEMAVLVLSQTPPKATSLVGQSLFDHIYGRLLHEQRPEARVVDLLDRILPPAYGAQQAPVNAVRVHILMDWVGIKYGQADVTPEVLCEKLGVALADPLQALDDLSTIVRWLATDFSPVLYDWLFDTDNLSRPLENGL